MLHDTVGMIAVAEPMRSFHREQNFSGKGATMLTTLLLVHGRLAAMEKALLLMVVMYAGVTSAVGIYEAWKNKRGPLGWIVNIIASVVGGTCGGILVGGGAMAAAGLVRDRLLPTWPELDALVGLPAMLAGLVLGSWLALKLVNRFR